MILQQEDNVKIFEPDHGLHVKIGGTSLDQVLPPEAVEAAQAVIQESADQFLAESFTEMDKLEAAFGNWRKAAGADGLTAIVRTAFAVKTAAGVGGYDLVAALAKSLHLYCERSLEVGAPPLKASILEWHVSSLRTLLTARIKGMGGAAGEAVMAEVEKLCGPTTA